MSDLVTPWTAASQAPLSMGFSRQEYWSGVPFQYKTKGFVLFLSYCSSGGRNYIIPEIILVNHLKAKNNIRAFNSLVFKTRLSVT